MSNLPTKTMIKDFVNRKMWNALDKFDVSKKAQVLASMLGTEIESKSIEWDECINKMQILYRDMIAGEKYFSNYCYKTGDYMKTMVTRKFKELYSTERNELEDEFRKILRNLDKINSPKKMLEYLKACELEYPVAVSVKEEAAFTEVDVTVYKPWVQNQLEAGKQQGGA